MKLAFEWDEAKARENLRKHKVGFDEGKTIFNDPFLLTFPDIETSVQRSVMSTSVCLSEIGFWF